MEGLVSEDMMHAGDRVGLINDEWGLVGHELILIDPEPVPGSSQCLVDDGGERITVSRSSLRPL